jgi:hypothetical protein
MHWNRANEAIRRKAKRDAAKNYGKRPDSWWKKFGDYPLEAGMRKRDL